MFGLLRLTCRSTRRILWEYALDRLSEGPMESVEAHLAQCNACQKELASVRRAQSLLAACREHVPPPPRTDWATLRSRLIAEGQPNPTESRESSPTYRGVSVQSLLEPRPAYRVRTKRYQLGIVGGMATFLLTAAVGYHSMLPANVAGTSPGKTMTAQPSLISPKPENASLVVSPPAENQTVASANSRPHSLTNPPITLPSKKGGREEEGNTDEDTTPVLTPATFHSKAGKPKPKTTHKPVTEQEPDGVKFKHISPGEREKMLPPSEQPTKYPMGGMMAVSNEQFEDRHYVITTLEPMPQNENTHF